MLESADDGISRAQSHFQAKFGSGFHAGGKAAHEVSANALHAVPESRSLLLDPAPCVSDGFFHLVPVLHHSSTHGDRSCDDSSSQQSVRPKSRGHLGNAHAHLGQDSRGSSSRSGGGCLGNSRRLGNSGHTGGHIGGGSPYAVQHRDELCRSAGSCGRCRCSAQKALRGGCTALEPLP